MMQTSTPVPTSLRRSALLRDISNSSSSSRRLSNVINQSLVVQDEADDELERSKRRNEAEIQRRLSNLSSAAPSPLNASNEKEIRDHFQICLKMFAENKISSKNAWNLKIIDYMRTVLHSQGLNKDSLQVASTSLDVSAKIYGIRVDDIHAEVLKLASTMARVNTQDTGPDDGGEQEDGSDENGDKENAGPKKKKKRRMLSGIKTTVAKNPESLLADVVKLESVFFQTRTNLDSSPIDNLFTNKLPMNHARYKFMLLSKETAWPTYNKKDSKLDFENSYPFQIKPLKNLQICAPFADFEIDEWDPEQEAQLMRDETNKPAFEEEIVYDADGIPIPELDGSIHDLFANADAENNYASSEEDEINGVAHDAVLTNKVAHIVDFRPEENGVHADDYSYSSVANLNNKIITQIWAGPSHWKLKHVRRTISKFSGQSEKQTNKAGRKTRIQPMLIDFGAELHTHLDKSKILKAKRNRIDECPIKCTLPQVNRTENNLHGSLMLKPVFISTNNKKQVEEVDNNCDDPEVKPYNYENPNDSLYCSQNALIDDDNGAGDDGDFQNEDEIAVPCANLLGENLVDAPELVPKTYIHYALQAKKMDMKKLKTAVWKSLISSKPNELIADDGMYNRKVEEKTFSEMYKDIPGRITEKMRQELSCPLVVIALLHLANEQNLQFPKHSDPNDFNIIQLSHFIP